jgi:formylglycine-generating enzyme required for sulfatase activity
MEDFSSRDASSLDFCLAQVAACDIFVGLIGPLFGSSPPGRKASFTQLEYEAAHKAARPRLLFLTADDFPLPYNLHDGDDARRRQQRFRKRVGRERLATFFGHEKGDLASRVVEALINHTRERQRREAERVPGRPGKIQRPDAHRANIAKLYLQRLAERYRYLELRGMGVSDRVPLRLPLLEMYVPLRVLAEAPDGETLERQRLAGRPVSYEEEAAIGHRLSAPHLAVDLLRKHSGLVLLGDPGAGKTTFLKYLALMLATGRGRSLGLGERLPVLVPLAAYANALAKKDIPLSRFIPRYYHDRDPELPFADLLADKLAHGEALLLLDGLDEVRELARRSDVVAGVHEFYELHRQVGNKFVLTSRVVGYKQVRLVAEGLAEATLLDFDDEEIDAFVEKWTLALEKAAAGDTRIAQQEARTEREELIEAVHGNPGVRALAANPLLLTILALMKRQGVALPAKRVELYERYVETLLKLWNLARSLGGRSPRDLDLVETLKVLQPLALWMHETSPEMGLVNEEDVHRQLRTIFAARGRSDPDRATRQFLEDVREHASLLLDRGGRRYGFIHLTFQEYLAAGSLAQKGQQEVDPIVTALVPHVRDASWHEVILLTVGYLGLVQQRDQAAGVVLRELMLRAPSPPGQAVILAGRAAADMGTGALPPPFHRQMIDALVKTITDDRHVVVTRRLSAGIVLADLGDPRPEVTTVDGMDLCLVPAGAFLMGSDRERAAEPWEKPRHPCVIPYDFWMARFPVTVGQFREFVAASGRSPQDPDSLRGHPNEPVVRVTWFEALAFCDWCTTWWQRAGRLRRGWRVRLPTEAEWEKAARGGQEIPSTPVLGHAGRLPPRPAMIANPLPARRFPWGDRTDRNRANYSNTESLRPSAAGCFPGGASPYGCEDMSGNVWEWTRSIWGEDALLPRFGYPYSPRDGREDVQTPSRAFRVLRGGAFNLTSGFARCACRGKHFPDSWLAYVGFRVLLAPHYR